MRNEHACKFCANAGECQLGSREKEVLSWAAKGKTAEETGTILGISRRTVEWHIQSARIKSGAANVVQAIAMAIRCGVIELVGMGMSGVGITAAFQSPPLRKIMMNAIMFTITRTIIS